MPSAEGGYVFNLPVVKFAKEKMDEHATFLPFQIINTKDKDIYVKLSIVNAGDSKWRLIDKDSQVTAKSFTVKANSSLKLNEKLVATNPPLTTSLDVLTLLLEYFKDSNYSQKFGEDVFTVKIHSYIQNPDGTWGNSAYSDDQIVFDTFDFSGIPSTGLSDGTTLNGVKGNANIYFKAQINGSASYVSDAGIITENSLKIQITARAGNGHHVHVWAFFRDSQSNLINDKFIVSVINVIGINRAILRAIYNTGIADGDVSRFFMEINKAQAKKVAFIPFNLYPALYHHAWGYYDWGDKSGSITVQYDGVTIFNLLE